MAESRLRVLIKRGKLPNRWVAICIDRYMVAEGDSPEEATHALHRVYRTEITLRKQPGADPLAHLPQAPAAYHSEYENASPEVLVGKRREEGSVAFDQRLHEKA